MSKRYFYRDPLAAAWISPTYNIKLVDEEGTQWAFEEIIYYAHYALYLPQDRKFYLAPAGYHILEQLPEKKKKALKTLGMWPEEEPTCEQSSEVQERE